MLVIDTRKLACPVRWEHSAPPEGISEGATFPHVYGPISLDAVVQTLDFEPNGDGEFKLPPLPSEQVAADRP